MSKKTVPYALAALACALWSPQAHGSEDGATVPSATTSDPASLQTESKPRAKKIPHNGFTIEARGGALGCTGSICRGTQNASAGGQLAGFIGGNIRGFVDVGLQGSWGKVRPDVAGRSVLDIYGIDRKAVEQEAAAMGAPVDLSGLRVSDADVSAANAGFGLRLHLVPRGRMIAYVGSGIGYQSYKSSYSTASGDATLRFHGLSVPIQGALGVHVLANLAVVAEGNYTWTHYAVADLKTPVEEMVAPMSILEQVAELDLQKSLPKFWGVTFGLRARF